MKRSEMTAKLRKMLREYGISSEREASMDSEDILKFLESVGMGLVDQEWEDENG